MVQPWAQPVTKNPKRTQVELKYHFDVSVQPSGRLALAIEQPQTFQIRLNGMPVDIDSEDGWWVDCSLRTVPLDVSLLKSGRNEITMTCDYSEAHPGLEIVYVLGDFGVAVSGTEVSMAAASRVLKLGDWVSQGLPFYSGNVCYHTKIDQPLKKGQQLVLQVNDYRGAAVRVLVDGKPAGMIAWDGQEVDLTKFVGNGPAELGIEVLGHRRNSHGPLHHSQKWPVWTGPNEFLTVGDKWQDEYQLVPCGLMEPPRLIVRQ
jgi:hypothetical protein